MKSLNHSALGSAFTGAKQLFLNYIKKTAALGLLLCILTAPNTGFATCSFDANNASCSAYGDEDDGWYHSYITITNGLTMYLYAVVPTSGTAFASVTWDSTGPVNNYSYGNLSSHSPYYYDPYATSGPISLGVSSRGTDSHAGVSVAW